MNIKMFVKRVSSEIPGFDPAKAEVLVLSYSGENKILPGFQTRIGFKAGFDGYHSWNGHVVLRYKGMIYDFDYLDKPTIVPENRYFRDMYVPKTISGKISAQKEIGFSPDQNFILDNLQVNRVPANQFMTDYRGNTNDPTARNLQWYVGPHKPEDGVRQQMLRQFLQGN